MTFQEVYDLVNKGKQAVVYSLTKKDGNIKSAQYMSDYSICQKVVYAAKKETYKESLFDLLGWPSENEDIVLYDDKNNIISRGLPEQTHSVRTFFNRAQVIDRLWQLMDEEAETWKHSVLDS